MAAIVEWHFVNVASFNGKEQRDAKRAVCWIRVKHNTRSVFPSDSGFCIFSIGHDLRRQTALVEPVFRQSKDLMNRIVEEDRLDSADIPRIIDSIGAHVRSDDPETLKGQLDS